MRSPQGSNTRLAPSLPCGMWTCERPQRVVHVVCCNRWNRARWRAFLANEDRTCLCLLANLSAPCKGGRGAYAAILEVVCMSVL